MSEYQYFEFQAIDRCLTENEMMVLRDISSRAHITPYSFINEYSWGNFKGDENLWMEKYFDAFLYYSNWGTHVLKLRIPSALLDYKTVQLYCNEDCFSVRKSKDKLILDFLSEDEGDEWEEDLKLNSFLKLRTDLIYGDLRCLYLAWLSGLQSDEYEEEEIEPPVPPGLQNLSPALEEFADFLRIDFDLINAAAKKSAFLDDMTFDPQDLQKWIETLSQNERDNVLRKILESSLRGDYTEVIQQAGRFSKQWQALQESKKEKPKQRTVGELLLEAENVREARIQLEAEKKAAERAKRQKLQRIAREKHLNEMVGREETLWKNIELLACEMKPKSYDKAIELLIDLRDLAMREKSSDFLRRLDILKQRHSSKRTFVQRLEAMTVKK